MGISILRHRLFQVMHTSIHAIVRQTRQETAERQLLTFRNLSIILIFLVPLLLLSTFPAVKGFDPAGSFLKPGEASLESAVIGTVNGFAYFGRVLGGASGATLK